MILKYYNILLVSIFFVACSSNMEPLTAASNSYKQNKDYPSMKIIHESLSKRTLRNRVEALLGKPDYSPTEGLYYYSTTKTEFSAEQNSNVTIGLIVDYRDNNDAITQSLQQYSLGPIGE